MVWVFRVVRPVATVQFWVQPDPELTQEFGPVANTSCKSKYQCCMIEAYAEGSYARSWMLPQQSSPRGLPRTIVVWSSTWSTLCLPLFWISPLALKQVSTLPVIASGCSRSYTCMFNVGYGYQTGLFKSPHPDMTSETVRSLANRQQHQQGVHRRESQHLPATRCISIPAGERDCSQQGSPVTSTIQAQKYTPSPSLNNSHIADIPQHLTSTLSCTQQLWIYTTTASSGISSHSISPPTGTCQTDSTCRIVSSPTSGIASTPTTLRSVDSLRTPSCNPEAHVIITYLLRMRATERNQREAAASPTAGSVYTLISGLRHSQHPLYWSLRRHASCICNAWTPGAVHLEHIAVYKYKWLGDGRLFNAMCWESNSWSPTLADNRAVLEHGNAAKLHFVDSIWGTHNGDLRGGMLKK